ncbi:MAG: ATP-dependent helicase [Clostridiales bacterium]|nr:ATP-dependent helicase [Clostridiales bacterium]
MQMNEAQQAAIRHLDGPALVIAGPGSGKTLVITERTRMLIDEGHAREDQILVITFTKAAASEMKNRFLRLRNTETSRVSFGTFHSVFFTILKHAYNYTADNIIREDVKYQFMKNIVHHMQLDYEDEKELIGELFSEISLVKGSRINLENYYSITCPADVFKRIFREYERILERNRLIDFDDMLLQCHRLLTERKDILRLWQDKFKYILIDEFQDINALQYDIVRMLALPRNNLFIVGDDDQSIYRFRGSKPEIMLQFPLDYPDCKRIVLNINYRSTPNIIEAADRLIRHNCNRFDKKYITSRESGKDVVICNCRTLIQENQAIAEEILRINREGTAYSQIAVLVRTTMYTGALVQKLKEYNIPFRLKDALPNLFDHWVSEDIISYIKIAMGMTERSLYLRIINRPMRYISRECFDRPQVDLEDLRDYYKDKIWMLERIDQLEYDLSAISRMNPFAAINYIRRGVGYEDYLKEYAQSKRIKAEDLTELLDQLQESARGFKSFEEWFAYIEDYRQEMKRFAQSGLDQTKDCVTISTMHSSKGLEYKVVIIADANEGITPHKKAVMEPDIEEERRLFYVAMTRARDELYIFSASERYNKSFQKSRFLDELAR